MREVARYHHLNIPEWAVPAIRGDYAGLTDIETDQVQAFVARYTAEAGALGAKACFDFGQEAYFSREPELGVSCVCVAGTILFIAE